MIWLICTNHGGDIAPLQRCKTRFLGSVTVSRSSSSSPMHYSTFSRHGSFTYITLISETIFIYDDTPYSNDGMMNKYAPALRMRWHLLYGTSRTADLHSSRDKSCRRAIVQPFLSHIVDWNILGPAWSR